MRLDIYLVQNNIFASREQAKYNISAGNVLVNQKIISKPAFDVKENDIVTVSEGNLNPYVSKGGLKLHKALEAFSIDCQGMDVLDVGASTGGFTDCALQHGAKTVYAIDVGTKQLSPLISQNPKVVSIENKHIFDLTLDDVDGRTFNIIVTDLSFISLTKVLAYFTKFLQPDGVVIALIKPQFEVGREFVGKGGIVRNRKAHLNAIVRIWESAKQSQLFLSRIVASPFVDSQRNIEYLALFEQVETACPIIESIVNSSFNEFGYKK
ncbi:MAG TPA: TlyA family RNA methyltransferase [Tenuifilaceae bacterium]|nr:TlyA family RNA methyltransferase [Tenuifilaceae bacterium]HPQ35470.1 TlyA family RNA methyltransferase [Tenuifilaceae bacterium]